MEAKNYGLAIKILKDIHKLSECLFLSLYDLSEEELEKIKQATENDPRHMI